MKVERRAVESFTLQDTDPEVAALTSPDFRLRRSPDFATAVPGGRRFAVKPIQLRQMLPDRAAGHGRGTTAIKGLRRPERWRASRLTAAGATTPVGQRTPAFCDSREAPGSAPTQPA